MKYPTLHKWWTWLTSDSTLLLVTLIMGIEKDRQMLVGFGVLGLLIIKYGSRREGQ